MEITFKLPPPLADSLVPFEVPEDQMDVFTILRLKETAAEISELNVEAVRLVTSQGKHLAPDDMLIEEFFSEQQQKTGVTIHIVKKSGGGGGVGAGSPRSAEITPAALKAVSSPSHGPSIPDGLLENPMIKSLMENPEFINSMIQSSPQLKNLTENNPEAKRMLTDPAFMSQMRNTMKNPKLMQEMMRNHDRQLQNSKRERWEQLARVH